MARTTWNELGAPQIPGDIDIEGLGVVEVKQKDIVRADAKGGNPSFELLDATTMGEGGQRRYVLGLWL